ncbi:unnamed protein product [Rotaria magnacalcarata]
MIIIGPRKQYNKISLVLALLHRSKLQNQLIFLAPLGSDHFNLFAVHKSYTAKEWINTNFADKLPYQKTIYSMIWRDKTPFLLNGSGQGSTCRFLCNRV